MADSSPPIRRDEVLRIAELSHLELSAEELDRMTRELASILSYVRKLEELDVSEVPPTAHVQAARLVLRDDEVRPGLPREQALAEAPNVARDGFAVPAFVDEG